MNLKPVSMIAAVLGVAVAALVLLGSWYTIDQRQRGVILRNGSLVGVAEPGLHFKLPLIESVVKLPVDQQVMYWTCAPEEATCQSDERREMQAYSQDQQPAHMRVTVSWHIPPGEVQRAYSEFGSVENVADRLVARKAPQDLKTVFGRFTAVSVIQDRAEFNKDVFEAIERDISGPAVIDGVQIENIDFSEVYEKSVEAAMQARVEVQRLQQQEQQQQIQAKITVINAQAAADARLAQAKAEAQATQIRGEAEAVAIKARGDALRDAPGLIALTAAEKWDGRLPTSMIPGSAVPFLELKP